MPKPAPRPKIITITKALRIDFSRAESATSEDAFKAVLAYKTAMTMLTNLQGGKDWRSDASVAYAILRITLGVNIGLRGMVRIAHGPAAFAQGIVKQMEATLLPGSLVYAFAATLVWVESAVGLLLILGLQTRLALIVGGLMMTLLMFGTMQIENFQNAWLQLTYALVFFVVLALRSWNVISLDAWLGRNKTEVRS